MPRVIFTLPPRVLVNSYLGRPMVLHLPIAPPDAVVGANVALSLCGSMGEVWSPLVWNRGPVRVCRFCRRNAVGIASLFLIGPERSEGPCVAPRRHPDSDVVGSGACGHPGDTSCKTALLPSERLPE